jgi:hypothetical protein
MPSSVVPMGTEVGEASGVMTPVLASHQAVRSGGLSLQIHQVSKVQVML